MDKNVFIPSEVVELLAALITTEEVYMVDRGLVMDVLSDFDEAQSVREWLDKNYIYYPEALAAAYHQVATNFANLNEVQPGLLENLGTPPEDDPNFEGYPGGNRA